MAKYLRAETQKWQGQLTGTETQIEIFRTETQNGRRDVLF
jgi:hypothetical protein